MNENTILQQERSGRFISKLSSPCRLYNFRLNVRSFFVETRVSIDNNTLYYFRRAPDDGGGVRFFPAVYDIMFVDASTHPRQVLSDFIVQLSSRARFERFLIVRVIKQFDPSPQRDRRGSWEKGRWENWDIQFITLLVDVIFFFLVVFMRQNQSRIETPVQQSSYWNRTRNT